MKQLKIALHSYCLSSRDESLILAQIRVHEYSRTPHFSTLDPRFSTLDSRVSKLERLDLRDARIEFRESSRDCQLTFERYCSCYIYTLNNRELILFISQRLHCVQSE